MGNESRERVQLSVPLDSLRVGMEYLVSYVDVDQQTQRLARIDRIGWFVGFHNVDFQRGFYVVFHFPERHNLALWTADLIDIVANRRLGSGNEN